MSNATCATYAERFRREARLASQFDHPNAAHAAHVYAFDVESDGLMWIAMEHVRDVPLDRWLVNHGAIPLDRFVPFLERLCEVVHSAHEQRIIHRDIKPANVDGRPRGTHLVARPVPCRGHLGFWKLTQDVEGAVLEQIAEAA